MDFDPRDYDSRDDDRFPSDRHRGGEGIPPTLPNTGTTHEKTPGGPNGTAIRARRLCAI